MTAAAALPRPAFAHASEAELARILDFYQVSWVYEPDTFPIGWNLEGEVVESFSPDFFLPDMDLYLELTTLKQKLVRKKNRKLRRLRELYPDVRIKLFYARDFRMLLLKFGRLALADELSGTIGQATPPRPADLIVAEAGANAGLAATAADRRAVDLRPLAVAADPTADPGADGEPDADPFPAVAAAGFAQGEARAHRRRRGRLRRRDNALAAAALLAGTAAGEDTAS